jgi:hypothetical protein
VTSLYRWWQRSYDATVAQRWNFGMETADVERWLEQLRVEHRDLDEVIKYMIETKHSDSMRIQRLKKRKLRLKDMIAKLESELIPDLDA